MHNAKLDILLFEDDLAEADLIREMLAEARGNEFSVEHVRYLADGLALLKNRSFDCILVDLGLPDSQGLETALAVRGQAKLTPIGIVTILDDEELALKALQMDIQDYLVKGEITGTLLVRSIRYAIQRKRIAEELRVSEERFRALVTASSEVLYRMSPDWSEMRQLFSKQFLAGTEGPSRTWRQKYIHPDDQPHVNAAIQEAIRTKSMFELEHRVRLADGSLGWTYSRAVPLTDDHGEIVEWFGAASNITDRKRAEEKIERLHTDLAVRAAELEDANWELEAFNHTVAHDLRQPLNIVNSFCQVIKELCSDKLDTQCAGYLREAYEGTLRMNRLIDTLLKFSQMAHIELRRKTMDLSRMAREAAEELRSADPKRRATFRIADGVTVDGDPALLRVVMDNLLGNAWKYTAGGEEAVIEFGVAEVEGTPAFFVSDNGPGFDMADAEKLFMPFQRLPGAEDFGGHGIGLATVERIIRRHGGRIWAEGEPGKGATFYFTLHS